MRGVGNFLAQYSLYIKVLYQQLNFHLTGLTYEPVHEISNNVVCATSKTSDQPAQSAQSLCKSLEYAMVVKLLPEHHLEFLSLKEGCTGSSESTLVKMSNCWKSHVTTHILF